jgi:hypothetical protein
MVTSDRVPTQKATESLPFSVAPVQAGEPQSLPRVRRDVHPTRPTFQNASPSYPRIPRLVSRYAKSATPNLDSQFQVNASHVQKPLSLIVQVRIFFLHVMLPLPRLTARQNDSAEKSSPVSAAQRNPVSRGER